ncbi:SDR family NAD(P)-dependent oxidoreductase [Natrarchaeobius sp. A-rgal3]|uniref:SDR family NAD(P)-dependent oxidoreductase n=1 Tax=Natrarchaeobius versutus TaxID=1679078 RepID=UPI00350ECAD4
MFSEQTVLVLSGTSDSGRALAHTVADAGGTVGFTYNSASEEAESVLEELEGDGHEAWSCDVTDPEETAAVIDEAFDAIGPIDGLVYTVGVIARSSIADTDVDDWQRHLDVNVTGAFNTIKAATPKFEAQGRGALVAVSACDGIMRSTNLAAYDASKQALIALVEEAARELGPVGVRANVVSPGFIRDPDALSEEAIEDLLEQQPYEQLTTPQEIANACLFLCSDLASTTTGAVLPVDSGLSLE